MNHDLSNKKENPEIREWTDIKTEDNLFAFRKNLTESYSYCHNGGDPKVNVNATFDEVVLEFSKFLKDSDVDWVKIK